MLLDPLSYPQAFFFLLIVLIGDHLDWVTLRILSDLVEKFILFVLHLIFQIKLPSLTHLKGI